MDVEFAITTNLVDGHDIDASFSSEQGSRACLTIDGTEVRLVVDYGPFDFDGLQSRLILAIADGVREYDLAQDAGTPAGDSPGDIRLGYYYDVSSSTTASFDTLNQAATGTVNVTSLPIESSTLEFTAQGTIGGDSGWSFDFAFSGTTAQ